MQRYVISDDYPKETCNFRYFFLNFAHYKDKMKNMTTINIKSFALISTMLLLFSCNGSQPANSPESQANAAENAPSEQTENAAAKQNIIRRHINIPRDFNYITNLGSIDIIWSQGDYSMEAEGDSALLQYIVTDFDSNLLTINLENDTHMDSNLYGIKSNLKVYISSPDLKCISICGNGSFETTGTWKSDDIKTGVMSKGSLKLGRIECSTFTLQSTDIGDISIADITAADITLYSNSSANISVNATAENMAILNDGTQHITISGNIKKLRVKNENDPNLTIKKFALL